MVLPDRKLPDSQSFIFDLVPGAVAGMSVVFALYPVDTIKTRLQSKAGFMLSGGFRSIYAGMGSVAVGSAPGSALFFVAYEKCKRLFGGIRVFQETPAASHMISASIAEVCACFVRVPTEVVKQRGQTQPDVRVASILRRTIEAEGLRGLYRGFGITVMREIPFSFIQFPLWEYFKVKWSQRGDGAVHAWQSALSGSVAGGIAASLTTPLDVVKTRIMLFRKKHRLASTLTVSQTFKDIWKQKGMRGLFAGVVPRTIWMSVGGLIFFGAYEFCNTMYRAKLGGDRPWSGGSILGNISEYLTQDWFDDMAKKRQLALDKAAELERNYDPERDKYFEFKV